MPASDSATATLTLAGKPFAASRALPSNSLSGSRRLSMSMLFSNDERRALQPVDRLARDHLHRMNGADRGGVDRIEPDQRAGRDEDATAIGAGEIDEIKIVEQSADADHDRGLAALHRRLDDRAQLAARRAFDHDVGGVAELVDRQNFAAGGAGRPGSSGVSRDRAPPRRRASAPRCPDRAQLRSCCRSSPGPQWPPAIRSKLSVQSSQSTLSPSPMS